MRLTVAAEQRALAPRNTNLTMLAYQEPPLMREGWKPPSVGHIPGPARKRTASPVGSKQHVPKLTGADQAKTRQRERCHAVIAKYPKFDRSHVSKVLGMSERNARHALCYWRDLGMIKDSGDRLANGVIVWEKK